MILILSEACRRLRTSRYQAPANLHASISLRIPDLNGQNFHHINGIVSDLIVMGNSNDGGRQERSWLYQKTSADAKKTSSIFSAEVSSCSRMLSNAINDMHQHFLSFTDDFVSSGVLIAAPQLLPGLKQLTEKFLGHARDVCPNDDDHDASSTRTTMTI
jgi:hypothetical protein